MFNWYFLKQTTSSSPQHPEEIQKNIVNLTIVAGPPKAVIEVEKIEFKSNNYLGTFKLPTERDTWLKLKSGFWSVL